MAADVLKLNKIKWARKRTAKRPRILFASMVDIFFSLDAANS